MQGFWKEHASAGLGMLGPGADEALAPLAAPEIRQRVLIAHFFARLRHASQHYIGLPLGRAMLERWMRGKIGGRLVEDWGLPRHVLSEVMGEEALTLHVDPRKLIQEAIHAPLHVEKRPSPLAFIWDGSWDERREDLRTGSRYRLISELDQNRHRLENTARYAKLLARIETGKPWASHQQGVFLDTPEKIRHYLRVYIGFMDDMALNGFDPARGKDALDVAISREGRILKIDRGLHRLAMAQRLGLPSIPVRVRHVHRLWWKRITEGAHGAEALQRVEQALRQCMPEESPGPLDEMPAPALPDDFWPEPRLPIRGNIQ